MTLPFKVNNTTRHVEQKCVQSVKTTCPCDKIRKLRRSAISTIARVLDNLHEARVITITMSQLFDLAVIIWQ